MIQFARDVDGYDARKVQIPYKHAFVEVASNRRLDIAIVSYEEASRFEEAESGDEVDIEWDATETEQWEFEFIRPDDRKYFLLFWNANDNKTAFVAYKITALA